MFLDQALITLKNNNQKITKTRYWLLEELSHMKEPLNPYELLKQSEHQEIDLTTIYRNLELFESIGLVHKIQSLGKYIICNHDTHCKKPHDIIICNDCNIINETHIDSNTKTLL